MPPKSSGPGGPKRPPPPRRPPPPGGAGAGPGRPPPPPSSKANNEADEDEDPFGAETPSKNNGGTFADFANFDSFEVSFFDFFLRRIVKIFEGIMFYDLCVALKVFVFVEKIFFAVYIGTLFQKYCFGIYVNDVQCVKVIFDPLTLPSFMYVPFDMSKY